MKRRFHQLAVTIMFFTILALVGVGDEVIYPNPGFPIYESVINFVGGVPVPIPLREDGRTIFVVLAGAKSPSVLVEIGFLSNAREGALVRKPDYRQKLAEALFRGLSRYAESLSHTQQVAKARE